MLERIRTIIKQKGQGIVEYALLLAFVVGIAMMLNSTNLGGSLYYLFDDVAFLLEGEKNKSYVEYFTDWHGKKTTELENISNRRRLEADQEALAFIAGQFLELNPAGVKELMGKYSNNWGQDWLNKNINSNYNIVDSEGWSEVLVPLSYKQSNIDDNGYVWLEAKHNIRTINDLTNNGATTYENQTSFTNAWGENLTGEKKSVTTDRLFYSNDMINHNGVAANDRSVVLQVHYNGTGPNATVDQVRISARTGTGEQAIKHNVNSKVLSNLDLTVSGTKDNPVYKVN